MIPHTKPEANVPSSRTQQASKRYALAQTALLSIFAVVVFLSPREYLFISASAAIVGNVLLAGIVLIVFLFFKVRFEEKRLLAVYPENKRSIKQHTVALNLNFRLSVLACCTSNLNSPFEIE